MTRYIFAFHGGSRPETPEAEEAAMAAWGAWMAEHAEALVDDGNPVGMSKTVTADGVIDNGGPNPLSGYAFVEVADLDAALAIARGCPILADGGTVEVAPVMEI